MKPVKRGVWVGRAAAEACDVFNPGLMREAGMDAVSFTPRRGGGFWVHGPAEQLAVLVATVRDRMAANGREGFGDSLPQLRSMHAFLERHGRGA